LKLTCKLLLTFIFISTSALAFKDDFVLKTGITLSQTYFNTLDEDDGTDEQDETTSIGVYTSFSYKKQRQEFGFDSRITKGNTTHLTFKIDDEEIKGEGSVKHVDMAIFYKVLLSSFSVPTKVQNFFTGVSIEPMYFYFKIAPIWSMQSLDLDNFNISSQYSRDHKLTNENLGGMFAIGIEEDTKYKSMHPIFFEVAMSITESYQVSLVDKSDEKEINILSSKEVRQDIVTYSVYFILGMTLF
jgi:hypothetical protein